MILTRSQQYQPTSAYAILLFLVCRFIVFVDPRCDLLQTMSISEDAAIDRLYTLQRLLHCTHTTELMASCSHSGGPMTFRQNPIYCMALSRPLRKTPLWAMSWVTLC